MEVGVPTSITRNKKSGVSLSRVASMRAIYEALVKRGARPLKSSVGKIITLEV